MGATAGTGSMEEQEGVAALQLRIAPVDRADRVEWAAPEAQVETAGTAVTELW